MSEFKEILKNLRVANNLSQADLAKKIGVSNGAISMYERGQRQPDFETLELLCDFFNVDTDYLLGRKNTTTLLPQSVFAPSLRPIRVPVLGRVPAGIPVDAVQDIIGWEELDPREFNVSHDYFALKILGDSMYPDYQEGDVVICEAASDAESGKDVIAYVNGFDATLKQLIKRDDGSIELRSRNSAYPPKIFSNEPVYIIGFVRELRRRK